MPFPRSSRRNWSWRPPRQSCSRLREQHAPATEVRRAEVDWFGAEETLTLSRAALNGHLDVAVQSCLPAEVQALRIGPWTFVAWPGEIFVEYALAVKARCPDTFFISLANGELQGYLATEEAARTGGYETSNALFAPEGGKLLTETTFSLLEQNAGRDMPLLIGIDLGTTGCKAAVYDEQGYILGESYLEYGLITLSATMIEQDPAAWWALTCQAVREALASSGTAGRQACAIAVSSQGISFVPVDAAGRPLGNAINWLDTRAVDESAALLAHFSEQELFRLTGKRASPVYVLPKLLWLRGHEPARWQATHKVLMGHDYLVYRLCGEMVTDHSLAGGTLLYDLAGQGWSARLLEATGLARGLLPAIGWAGTRVGRLTAEAAEALGLSR